MSASRPRERSHVVNVGGCDKVEVSSIDSFPASDPPGWIEAKAQSCEDGPAACDTDINRVQPPSKRVPR